MDVVLHDVPKHMSVANHHGPGCGAENSESGTRREGNSLLGFSGAHSHSRSVSSKLFGIPSHGTEPHSASLCFPSREHGI